MFAAVRVVVPAPAWVKPPAPEINTPAPRSVAWLNALLRLMVRLAPVEMTMELVAVSLPVVPPLPSDSVPAPTVVVPV